MFRNVLWIALLSVISACPEVHDNPCFNPSGADTLEPSPESSDEGNRSSRDNGETRSGPLSPEPGPPDSDASVAIPDADPGTPSDPDDGGAASSESGHSGADGADGADGPSSDVPSPPDPPEVDDGSVGEKPGPHNTGWRVNVTEDELVEIEGTFVCDEPGVYENYKFLGPVVIAADNVTIRNSWFHPVTDIKTAIIHGNNNHKGLVIEHCEADQSELAPALHGSFIEATNGSHGAVGAAVTIRYSHFRDFWTDILGLSYDSYCEYSYFERWELAGPEGFEKVPHGDAQQTGISSRNVHFYRNAWHLPWGQESLTPNASHHATAVGTYSDGSPHFVENYVLEENWINGGGYAVYLRSKKGGRVSNSKIIGNRWGRDFKHGCVSIGSPDGSAWDNVEIGGNVWEDTGEPVSNGDPGGFSQSWE